jgi:RND family efflux transporter MFP subunit
MTLRLILLFLFFIAGGSNILASDPNKILAKAFKVQKYEFYEKYTAIGQSSRAESRDYYANKAGVVNQITPKQGKKIQQGEIIIAIESNMAKSNLEYAEANLQSAKRDLERNKSLLAKNVLSKKDLDSARVAFEKAESEYYNAIKAYNDAVIKAPFEGMIGVVNATVGNNVNIGDYLFSIITEKEAAVFVELPETLHGKIFNDTEVILSDSNKNKVRGVVSFISPYLSDKGTITVKIQTDEDNNFIHGSYLSVEFTINKHVANGILQSAILKNDKGSFVYKIQSDGSVSQLYLDLGTRTNDMIEVLSDNLKENDLIVSEGLTKVRDGASVEVEE